MENTKHVDDLGPLLWLIGKFQYFGNNKYYRNGEMRQGNGCSFEGHTLMAKAVR